MKKRAAFPIAPLFVVAMLMYLFFPGCGSRQKSPLTEELASRCVVMADGASSSGWEPWLDEHLKKSPRYARNQLHHAAADCLKSDSILLVPGAVIDEQNAEALEDYLVRGGRLLMLGKTNPAAALSSPRIKQATGANLGSYHFTSSVFRASADGESLDIPALPVASVYPPASGEGGKSADAVRWIPVWEAANAYGATAGWAGSVLLVPQADAGHSICGWLSIDPVQGAGQALETMVAAMILGTGRDAYLMKFGTSSHSVRQNQLVEVSAAMIDRRTRDFSPLRLAVRWLNKQGQEVRRHVSEPLDSPAMQTDLSAGAAPDPSGKKPEMFTLELSIRDRNDLETMDIAAQQIKVFPREDETSKPEPISVNGHELMLGRRPLFLLGVNYWPRLSAQTAGTLGSGHWLSPARFNPSTLAVDLDLMAAAGINSVALEYTDVSQAPQLRFFLDELRKRSMWASIYMPSLHPFDLRQEEALAMLDAVRAEEWPEWCTLELARGLAIRSRADLRRFDDAWSEWLDEHFGSVQEAEQKLGVSIWRERGALSGPPDNQLRAGPHQDRAVALYFSFLQDHASRHIGYVRRLLRNKGYNMLVTVRSSYGWPSSAQPESIADTLDISTGAIHQDILSPDGWMLHPLNQLHDGQDLLMAYVTGAGRGKPVVWSAYGQHVGTDPAFDDFERQKDVYRRYLEMFIQHGSAGAFAWWYPGGVSPFHGDDWGLVEPHGVWRSSEEAFRTIRMQLRQVRSPRQSSRRVDGSFIISASQWRDQQEKRMGMVENNPEALPPTELSPPGTGLDTLSLLNPDEPRNWSEIDGLHLLNSEWGQTTVDQSRQDRKPGESLRTYTQHILMLELINSGTVRWANTRDQKRQGSVWVRITQPGFAEEWVAASEVETGGKQEIAWTPREPGLWEIQPYLVGYGKFGERLKVEATLPPRLY